MNDTSEKNHLSNVKVSNTDNHICINNPDYFLTFSDLEISDGIDIVENIIILKDDVKNSENLDIEGLIGLTEDYKETNNISGSYIATFSKDLEYFTNTYNDYGILNIISNDVSVEDFTDKLKVANSPKGFKDARINLGEVILINKSLSPKLLINIYKTCIKAKTKFLDSWNENMHEVRFEFTSSY